MDTIKTSKSVSTDRFQHFRRLHLLCPDLLIHAGNSSLGVVNLSQHILPVDFDLFNVLLGILLRFKYQLFLFVLWLNIVQIHNYTRETWKLYIFIMHIHLYVQRHDFVLYNYYSHLSFLLYTYITILFVIIKNCQIQFLDVNMNRTFFKFS